MARTEAGAKQGVALLDVNVLIALLDPDHVHHELAGRWFSADGAQAWATCPLTQNGCLRILSQPNYIHPFPFLVALAALGRSCLQANHHFWPDDVSLLDEKRFQHAHVHGHRLLTDLYLLALAVRHGGRFVTFDAKIPLSAVQGAKARHLVSL